jgi:hypothetical protein
VPQWEHPCPLPAITAVTQEALIFDVHLHVACCKKVQERSTAVPAFLAGDAGDYLKTGGY